MRKKKNEKLKLMESINRLCTVAGVPDGTIISEIPPHVLHFRGRLSRLDDEDLARMPELFRSIDRLDLDNTDITNEGVRHLAQLECIKELRLKDCSCVDNGAIQYIVQIKGLQLLHLGGTKVTLEGLTNIERLENLKLLLLSSNESDELINEKVITLTALLPGCHISVNSKPFPL